MCLATMTYVYVSTKKKNFFVSLQRYEPVVGSGNLRVNSTLLAEMSAFCSQVNWEESVSASDPACSLMFAVSVPCVTSLYHINRDFSIGAVWFEELSYCSHCFHRFQSGKALVDVGMKYYASCVSRPLPAFIVVSFQYPSPEVWCLNYISRHMG